MFIQVTEKSGKTDNLVSIPFSLTIGMAVCSGVPRHHLLGGAL